VRLAEEEWEELELLLVDAAWRASITAASATESRATLAMALKNILRRGRKIG